MAALSTTTLRAAGVPPASMDITGTPGTFVMDYIIDGSKQAVAAADTVDFFDLPALAALNITAAAVTVMKAGTATGTLAIQVGGGSVTGLTAWPTDATAGTRLIKLATAANTVVNTGSASAIRFLQGTAGLGNGILKIRVFGTLMEAPSNVS